MVTDHDVGVEGAEPVSHERVVTVFNENNERLRELLFAVIPKIRRSLRSTSARRRSAARASKRISTRRVSISGVIGSLAISFPS